MSTNSLQNPNSTNYFSSPTNPGYGTPQQYQQMASYPSTTNITSGSSGSGSGGNSGTTTTQQNTGGGTSDITSQLDAIFAPVMSALQGQESTAQNNYNIQTGDITQQGAAAQSTLDAQNASGTAQLDQLGTTAGQTKSDALTAATELYNELSRGGQQRFGGSSSAGEAYGALTAVEQQKRQGAIQTAFSNAMDQVAQYKNTLLTNYTAAKTNLTSQINSQLASATQNFNDAISSIKTAEGQAASDKAQATLNTLQDYRNKVYTINLQGQQAMQALEQQGTVSMSAVDNYTQQMLTSLQNGSNTVVNMATAANNAAGTTKLGVGTVPTTTTVAPTGTIASTTAAPAGYHYDQLGNLVAN